VDDQPGRLVDDDEVAVLVEHDERDRLGDELERLGRRDRDREDVAEADAVARLGDRDGVDGRAAVVDEALGLRAGQRGDERGQRGVEPGGRAGGDRDGDGLPVVAVLASVYQIFDLTCPLDFTSTSTIARS
jgi:hypothetical protein